MFSLASEKFRGLQCDIMPLVNMVSKIARVELCTGKDSNIESLEKDLECDRYRWKNRQECDQKPDTVDVKWGDHQILAWQPVAGVRNPDNEDDCKVCQVT